MRNDIGADQDPDDVVSHIPALRAFAWSLCRREQDVDDLVQETLVKAIASYHRYERGTRLRSWLFTILRNTFLTSAQKATRETTGSEDCVSGSAAAPGTQYWSVRGSELRRAILTLPPHYREVLVLVVMLGESYETTAEICGVAMGTVKSRVNRARNLIIAEMEGKELPYDVAPREPTASPGGTATRRVQPLRSHAGRARSVERVQTNR